jgi:hypothetical protein
MMVMALLMSSNEADCLSSQHGKQHANLKDTQQLMRSLYRASGLAQGQHLIICHPESV